MRTTTTLAITQPGDPVSCHMGGTDSNIPQIVIGAVTIYVHPDLLTPAEQKAWLTNFARQVQLLANSIAPDAEQPIDEDAVSGVVAFAEVPC